MGPSYTPELSISGKNDECSQFMNMRQNSMDSARLYPSPPPEDPGNIGLRPDQYWNQFQNQFQSAVAAEPQYADQLYQEPADMCIDTDIDIADCYAPQAQRNMTEYLPLPPFLNSCPSVPITMNSSESMTLATVPSLTFDHAYDQMNYSEVNQMYSIHGNTNFQASADMYNWSSVCNNEQAFLLDPQAITLQDSYMSCDSAISGCEPMETSAISYCEPTLLESELQNAKAHSMLPKIPVNQVSDLLGGGLDKLLPMEKSTILVTSKDYTIYRYWTQQDTIFGYNPDVLPARSIRCILSDKSFKEVYYHKRTESYDECIIFCGDRTKVRTSTGEQWMTFWMKESKIENEYHYTFVFVDNCVPIARIDETGRITGYSDIYERIDIKDYINVEPEQLQGHHYQELISRVDSWHTSKYGSHYFIAQEKSSVDIIAVPQITGLVSIYYDKTIAWCSEAVSCCLFGLGSEQAKTSKIIDRLPQFPEMIDHWLENTDKLYTDNAFRLKDLIHGGTLMYEWCRSKFGKSGTTNNDDEKPRLVALRDGLAETQVEMYIKFSSHENVPHWVFVKNVVEWGTTHSDYKVLENRIGQGSYGSAYTAYDKKLFRKVTIKYVDKSRVIREGNRKKKSLPAEIEVLKVLQRNAHPNCSEMYTYFDDPTYYYIVMGNYGKTLYSFIDENRNLPEKDSQYIFKQIVEGVYHLHETLNIVHRDIKDENIMIDDQRRVRLIDFGSAAILKTKGRKFNTFVGTVDYAAPEVLSGQTYTGKPQDVWALGVLLYTIIHHSSPFRTAADIIEQNLHFPFSLDHDLRALIVGMLRGIKTRINIRDVRDHIWLCKEIS